MGQGRPEPGEGAMQIGFTLDIYSDLETVFSWIANPDKAMV